jgi:hypothetical protein
VAERRIIIDLPVRNEWRNIELVRTAILNCFAAVFDDVDSSRSIAWVISELLENAVKYGSWDSPDTRMLHLAITGIDNKVKISVEHPVEPDGKHMSTLNETLRWLASFPTPADAYQARLSALAETTPENGISRLGLARIACEGNCTLSTELSGRTLRVFAEMTP